MKELSKDDIAAISIQVRDHINATTPQKRKANNNWEKRMVREYVALNYPNNIPFFNQRIGPIQPSEIPGLTHGLRRWVDVLIMLYPKFILIEGKCRPEAGAVSQLTLYKRQFPLTPEFTEYADKEVITRLVTMYEDETVRSMCEEMGHEYEVFRPSFFRAYEQYKGIGV
jgi:hypothetical protein